METRSEKNKVVMIDDDQDLLKLMTLAFKKQGFVVIGLTSGQAALEYFENNQQLDSICCILLDRMLGDMDGLNLVKVIHERVSAPLLILSVLSAERDVMEGLKRGAVDYIAKPFSLPLLLQQVNALIKVRALR